MALPLLINPVLMSFQMTPVDFRKDCFVAENRIRAVALEKKNLPFKKTAIKTRNSASDRHESRENQPARINHFIQVHLHCC